MQAEGAWAARAPDARKGQELEELSKKQNISWEADQGSGAFHLGEWGREEENCDAGKHRFSILRS